jgi:protein-tyrosine phosphatase
VNSPGRILIVCTGNVCRSPFIERILRSRLMAPSAGAPPTVVSAGTGALVGQPMDERAAARLVDAGGSPEGFVAQQLTKELVASAQLVLTATRRHRADVATLHPKALRYAFTFRDFADLASQIDPPGLDDATPAATRVQAVVERVAARRGVNPPLTAAEADIVDPFRRGDEVFVQMSHQVLAGLPAVVRALSC